MENEYVRQDEHGVMRIANTRVMLDSVVAAFEQGHCAETIQSQYPTLTLEQVYGAIAYFFRHQDQVREYLQRQSQLWEEGRRQSEAENAAFLERLRASRR